MLVVVAPQTRDLIVREALRLFAESGYAATSVSQIEKAAGLKPGAGGLYSHFPSKRHVLDAAVASCVSTADAAYAMHAALPLEDLRSELTVLVRGSLQLFDATGYWVKLRAREAAQFPDLFSGKADLSNRARRYLSDWLSSKVAAGLVTAHDTDAMAEVLFGAISSYWHREAEGPRRRSGVDRPRFIAAWVDLTSGLLASGAAV